MFIYMILIMICVILIIIQNYEYNKRKYKMAIMAIFKNEDSYMEEWLDHHIKEGFDHIYLYSNDPDMNKYKYLSSQKYKGYITVIPWIDKKNDINGTVQRKAYTHCVQTYKNEYQYIMMLDLDEFVINITGNSVRNYIESLNPKYTKALKIQRYNFGSNGHIKRPKGKIMDNYNKHEKICSSYKTMANIDFVDTSKIFYGVHDFRYNRNQGKIYNKYFDYKYKGYPNGCKKENLNETPLVINHYYTKSYDEYLNRCHMWKNGGINNVGYRQDCEKNFRKNDVNEVEGY